MNETLHEAVRNAIRAALEAERVEPPNDAVLDSCARAAVDAAVPYIELILQLRPGE